MRDGSTRTFGPEDTVAPDRDAFQQMLLDALHLPGNGDAEVTADVDALVRLHRDEPARLQRHLAASPAWRVFDERDARFATRRWRLADWHEPWFWRYTLHGYHGRFDVSRADPFGLESGDKAEGFQTRLTLGFSGQPWARLQGGQEVTRLAPGASAKLGLGEGNQLVESWLVVEEGDLVVELFEQSSDDERRLTTASLALLEAELSEVLRGDFDDALPADAVLRGPEAFDLHESSQPGIYDSQLRLNPGEPGEVYLKAFEVTQGTAISVDRLRERSAERMGWSEDPGEVFLSNTNFTIYEGDWDEPYAARVEVWFVPDARQPERKLMEKPSKIEGWMR